MTKTTMFAPRHSVSINIAANNLNQILSDVAAVRAGTPSQARTTARYPRPSSAIDRQTIPTPELRPLASDI
jgi:hypothetical protein